MNVLYNKKNDDTAMITKSTIIIMVIIALFLNNLDILITSLNRIYIYYNP